MFCAEIWTISEFLSENFQFFVVKFSIYLNKRVFVMISCVSDYTKEMPQSGITALLRHQKKERWGTNNDITYITYEISDTKQRWTAKEETYWNSQLEIYLRPKPALLVLNLTLNSDAAPNYKYMFGPNRGHLNLKLALPIYLVVSESVYIVNAVITNI